VALNVENGARDERRRVVGNNGNTGRYLVEREGKLAVGVGGELDAVDRLVLAVVDVRRVRRELVLVVRRQRGELGRLACGGNARGRVRRAAGNSRDREALRLGVRLGRPRASDDVVDGWGLVLLLLGLGGQAARSEQIQEDRGKLRRAAALREEDGVRVGDAVELAEVGCMS